MKKKAKILLISYITAALLALGLTSWAGQRGLGWYRRTAEESADLAFEETVRAVEELSLALRKSAYVTDSTMAARVCGEAYARAEAAEAALSTLPFSTWELEQLSGFLNLAGDYAYSLCGQQELPNEEQQGHLAELSKLAEDFAGALDGVRQGLNDGELRMDSREKRLRNIEEETALPLSARLLELEEQFVPPEPFAYEGRYSPREEPESRGYLTEEEMQQAAADFLGIPANSLKEQYRYEGVEGRRCFRVEDSSVCVSRSGVESYSQSRLPGEPAISMEEAQALAEGWLDRWGYGELRLCEQREQGGLARFRYAREADGALCTDACLRIAVALDDGSLYSFDATDYCTQAPEVDWPLSREEAETALPEGLRVLDCARRVRRSPGGRDLACYEFSCEDEEGRSLRISVDAETGKQWAIEF